MDLIGERDALVVVDRYSVYIDCFPLMTKTAPDAHGALLEYFGSQMPQFVYTDMSRELIKPVKDMLTPHGKSTPYRHQSNGYAERTVRKVVEGARTLLGHAGLPSRFWTFAVIFFCFMHNTAMRDGDSPWNLRHGSGHFVGPRMPFGCLVDFLPKPDSIKAMPKFEPWANQGIPVGYRLQPGGQWAKDFLVFPMRYFDEYDYSRPRHLRELTPITTQEVKLIGEPTSPLKPRYDVFKRTLPLCIIRGADHFDEDIFEDKEDSDSPVRGGPGGVDESDDGDAALPGQFVENAVGDAGEGPTGTTKSSASMYGEVLHAAAGGNALS